MLVPYNQSQFRLMFKYPQLFRKLWLKEQEEEGELLKGETEGSGRKLKKNKLDKKKEKKQFKIVYHINILPSVSQEQGQLMDAIAKSDELDIFMSACVQDLIKFKWESFAFAVHKNGFYFHFCYIGTLIMYINSTYLGIPHI